MFIIGCVQAVIDEAKTNLHILGAVALALAVPQVGPTSLCCISQLSDISISCLGHDDILFSDQ